MPQQPCKYCATGNTPDKRFGWYWHWDDSIKALVSCADKNANVELEPDK